MIAHGVARIDCERRPYKVVLDNCNSARGHLNCLIYWGTVHTNRGITQSEKFEGQGQGIYYCATDMAFSCCEPKISSWWWSRKLAGTKLQAFMSKTRKTYAMRGAAFRQLYRTYVTLP